MIVAIVLLVLLAVGVVNLLLYFGNWRTYPWYVQVTCFVAWMFPFAIILMLPLDLASTLYRACDPSAVCDEPFAYVPEQFLWVFWQMLYWTMFSLTWFTIPVMQAWMRSGDFHSWPRFINAIKENLFWYAIFGVIGIAALLYIIFGLKINQMGELMPFLMAAANAWGLLVCTFMLGYGFVDIPRKLWYHANARWKLRFLELQAPKTKEAMVDAEAELYDVAKDVSYAARFVSPDSTLRPYVERLLEKCPFALNERATDDDVVRPSEITMDYLKTLHARIKYGVRIYERNKAQYHFLVEKAWMLSDIIQNENNIEKKFKSPLIKPMTNKYEDVRLKLLWWWYIWLKPILTRTLSVTCMIASVAFIWSESTFQVKSLAFPLSIPAAIMRLQLPFALVEGISITFLLFMCSSAYSVLFQVKIFDFYVMVPEHHTDENSLLFVGAYLCRLMFPLCYNFLNMAWFDDIAEDKTSVFVRYQGKAADLTPLLGGFVNWVPQLVLFFSTLTLLNLYGRILSLFRIKGYLYAEVSKNSSDSDLDEGRNIISQARVLEERRLNRAGADDAISGGPLSLFRNNDRNRVASNRAASRATNTKDLLEKYKSRKNNDEAERSNVVGSTSAENLRDSPVLSRSLPAGTSFSLKPSFFGSKAAAKSSTSEAVGSYKRLEENTEEAASGGRRFGKAAATSGSRSQDNSPSRAANASNDRLNEARSQGSSRLFGTASPTVQPAQPVQPAKKSGTRNIFDDV